jgi:hypothetical protein
MPWDAVFGFPFNIDFHPTRRQFLQNDPNGPWASIHTATRNWSTRTDRAMFPLRRLVPVDRDGLLGASKNIGVSSSVRSALRLHGQMMLCVQASGTLAWLCLRDDVSPGTMATDANRVREIQRVLVRGVGGPGVLIWPYHDLPPEHPAFEAAHLLSLSGVWPVPDDSVRFRPEAPLSHGEWEQILSQLPATDRRSWESNPPADRTDAVIRLCSHLRNDVRVKRRPPARDNMHANGSWNW